jgi:transposase InsO family protein
MRKSRFTESQIVSILKDGDAGIPLAELVRKHGVSRATYFNWKSKLDQLIALYGRPDAIRLDNGPELTSQVLTDWAAARAITLIYIQPGKPVQNAFIERFNRTYRRPPRIE